MRAPLTGSGLRLALVGDVMPSRRLSVYQEAPYLALVDLLRQATLSFANLETTVREPHEGQAIFTRGTPMSTPPALIEELRWMGFGLVSCANNHATDYGIEGLMAGVRHLQHAGLPAAGQGVNLAAARAPVYVDTPAGRVALVAATSFFPPASRAAAQRGDDAGRPGVHAIGVSTRYEVDEAAFEALRRTARQLGFEADRVRKSAEFYGPGELGESSDAVVSLLGAEFHRAAAFATHSKPLAADMEGLMRSLSEAKRQADLVLFSYHYHDLKPDAQATSMAALSEPAPFVEQVCRAAIEGGADIVAGHGPHMTMGIEIYQGKPILYSLGNFVFHNESVATVPGESYARFKLGEQATPADFFDARNGHGTRGFPATREYWESYAATCEWDPLTGATVRVHPVDLGFGRERPQRGRPQLADEAVASRVIERLRRLSAKYGTAFVEADGCWRVQAGGTAPA